ncbi:MAG TPA: tetratricopeptide repeat protein [Geobacteraceae bacterium]|nr:tetratricopeptide repeat protein [Geobacteraceae bacterium]
MKKKAQHTSHDKSGGSVSRDRKKSSGEVDSRRAIVLAGIVLMVITFAVYWQAGSHDFIHLDDNVYVTQNPQMAKGLTLSGIVWALTSVDVMYWHPVTLLSHLLDVQLYGMNPHGHHLTSVIIHVFSTGLLLLLLFRLTGTVWQSSFVAALFALHPLHVESVAWVAERKDVLSAFFWFLTLLLYAAYVKKRTTTLYLLTFAAFVLGLMSKPMIVTLPVVLLLLDFWPLGRYHLEEQHHGDHQPRGWLSRLSPLAKEKVPFLACSIFSAVVTIYAQIKMGGMPTVSTLSLGFRLENALVAYLTYISKTLWPHDLAIMYPLLTAIPLWYAVCALVLLLLVSAATIRLGRHHPYLPVGWFWFLITLLPVIGLTQAGVQSTADRFTYIPHIGLFIMVAWGVPALLKKTPAKQWILGLLAGGAILASALVTWQQLGYWQDEVSLYQHALRVTSSNYTMHANLGGVFLDRGDLAGAIREYRSALEINPNYADGHYNLGVALATKGDLAAAIKEFQQALTIKPKYADAHNNLGVALAASGDLAAAIREYQAALAIRPAYSDAHNNLGIALAARGDLEGAIREYRTVLAINPDYAAAHNNLGEALAKKGELEAAIEAYQKALALNPNLSEAQNNLAAALALKKGH